MQSPERRSKLQRPVQGLGVARGQSPARPHLALRAIVVLADLDGKLCGSACLAAAPQTPYDPLMTQIQEHRVPQGREYELKFSIDPSACEALVAHPVLVAAMRDRELAHLSSTYFDTPDERLRRAHVSLRVRTSEAGALQTLKAATGSMVDRAEWEQPATGSRPDDAFLRATPLKPLFEAIDGTLAPRFTVDVTRSTFPLLRGKAGIEAALDRGTICAGGRVLDVSELELESKRGRPDAVFDVARDLVRDLPLTLSLESKAMRGFAVADRSFDKPIKTLVLDLRPEMTRAQAFEAMTQACLLALTHNAALIAGEASGESDGEAVHKTRISLRRLRAAFALFQPCLRGKRRDALMRDLRWASHKLGAARDADVLRDTYVGPAAREPRAAGVAALVTVLADRRTRAHATLLRALASRRWRMLLVELLAFSIDGVRRSHRPRGFRGFVRRRVATRRGALGRQAKRFARLSPRALHDMRKSAKTLRYDLEMLADLPGLSGKRVARLVGDLGSLQDKLGLVQDRAAAQAMLDEATTRYRPAGVSRRAMREAVWALRPAALDDARLLRKAGHVARRLRRPVVFA